MSLPSTAAAAAAAATAAAAAAARICFNTHCKGTKKDQPPCRKGWRLRSGDYAVLCDCCGCAYEQGAFCEAFHASDPGWRNCEVCGKRVHCGCVVSTPLYVLLDTGGIECIGCARSAVVNAPNQIRPFLHLQASDRSKYVPTRSPSNVTGPYTGQWRQVPKWTLANSQSEIQRRISFEFERPNYHERVLAGGRLPPLSQEKKPEDLPEKIPSGGPNHVARDIYANTNNGLDSINAAYNTCHRESADSKQDSGQVTNNGLDSINAVYNKCRREVACAESADSKQDSGQVKGERQMMAKKGENVLAARKGVMSIPSPATSSGINIKGYPSSVINSSSSSSVVKDEAASPLIGLAAPYPLSRESSDLSRDPASHLHGQQSSNFLIKQIHPNSQIAGEISCDLQTQMRNGRIKADVRNRLHFHPRYSPKITNEELQQISGDSNSVITPLFEKVLSASDAGKIGRLVLPKKCAEAYFPTISQPEGLPIKVQDVNGKEWVFQFRFWPNNNSRMYVLEGVTPCIHSMQLQAGDTVTFSRMDPVGKLIMGFRKASNISMEQDTQTAKAGNGISTPPEVNGSSTPESGTDASMRSISGMAVLKNEMVTEDLAMRTDIDKAGFIQKDGHGDNARLVPTRRKGSTPGSKSKRLRIENEESIELKVTWEEAQILLRPRSKSILKVIDVEGQEFEEFEEAPLLGKPTIIAAEESGEKIQWVQCERCSKWRKMPVDALLTFKWTCSDNTWDHERASCTSAEELSMEQLSAFILTCTGTSKKSKAKVENETVDPSDGLDTLANLAILGEGEALASTSQVTTTKHPRHRPGCSCIVCIQPPSGKGPKHQQSCTCNVCLTVRRRFRTLMLRRERRQSEKDAEKQQQPHMPTEDSPQGGCDDPVAATDTPGSSSPARLSQDDALVDGESERRVALSSSSLSPLKANIDLNIQPEREEEHVNPRDSTDTPNCPGLGAKDGDGMGDALGS